MESIASLFFSSSLLISSLFPLAASATSFGPIPLTEQVRNAQYFVHGKIAGNGSVAMERPQNPRGQTRPHTYWKVIIIDQSLGPSLGGQVDIREPGGEIGQMGYHVAGSATFRDGEEVFVALRDTDEQGVKEVFGLSSGKYTVEEDGKSVKSGLGPIVTGPNGTPLSAEEFGQILRRAASGRETPSDKSIFVNRGPKADGSHDHEEDSVLANAQREAEAIARTRNGSGKNAEEKNSTTAPSKSANPFKTHGQEPEKSSTGTSSFWWIFALAAGAILVAILVVIRR